jgi:hypothetical protein
MVVGFKTMVAAALAALGATAPAGAPELPSQAAVGRDSPPGEGVICAAGLYAAAAEVGRRCLAHPDPAVQAELDAAVARFDAYMLADPDWNRAALDRFKREQALVGSPAAELCASDAVMIYRGLAEAGAESLRISSQQLVSRPGRPTWGDCL